MLSGSKDFESISKMLYEAYDISKSLNDDITKLAVTIDLSKYYKSRELKDSTLKYAEKAYKISKQISSKKSALTQTPPTPIAMST